MSLLTNRKTWASIALVFCITVLPGCAQESRPEPQFEGTITLWSSIDLAGHPGDLEAGWLEERAKAYEAAHKGVTVAIRQFESGEALEEALLAGGEGPDLYLGRPLAGPGDRQATLPLKPDLLADQHAGAMTAFRLGDAAFGLPFLMDVQVLALNEELFRSRSVTLPAEGQWSEAEFAGALAKLAGGGVAALGFPYAPGYYQWWPLAGGLFGADGSVAPGAEAAIGRLAAWRREGLLTPDLATLTTEEAYRRFASGQIAVMPAPAWAVPLLRAEPYSAPVAVAGFPGGVTVGHVYGVVALRADSDRKLAAAADLAAFLTAPDQAVRLARASGLLPARKSAPNPFEGDALMTRVFRLAAGFQPLPAGPAWDRAQEGIARELLLALYGGKKPAEALQGSKKILEMATTPAP